MIKARWGKNAGALRAHLSYIAGGKEKKMSNGEIVYPAKSISTPSARKSYLAKHRYFLEPKGNGRRSKTTDLRIIMSFQGALPKNAHKIAIDFLQDNFPNMCATYAIHRKPVSKNASGEKMAGWHVHFVICPRKPDGKMLRLNKRALRDLKASYHELAKRHNLRTGWELEQHQPEPNLSPLSLGNNGPAL